MSPVRDRGVRLSEKAGAMHVSPITRHLDNIPTTAMKQRITYVVTEPESFNPEQISVQQGKDGEPDTFEVKRVKAAKEHRITLGLDELSKHKAPFDM
jgi:hypothetical protein